MCGIAGIVAFNGNGREFLNRIEEATDCLAQRGPDDKGIYIDETIALGHRRLSIIDTSHNAAQPMSDEHGRFKIIFNGEFFNYAEHRNHLEEKGIKFRTHSDTEVLLHLYMREGPACLEKINGFFALAIYDSRERNLFIARDRLGVKPLTYYHDNDKLMFASELKSLFSMGVPKKLDRDAVHLFFRLNYLPANISILQNVRKLKPGHYLFIPLDNVKEIKENIYYKIPYRAPAILSKDNYNLATEKVLGLLDHAVQRRLVSDVPVGAFLSGGIDSSAIVALASRHVKKLNTFSIGFKDQPHFDETHYAEMVANKFKTNHVSFRLTTDDLLSSLFNVLDYIDEPFADSSALNVYILSRETRKHVTVALSGDGADELFGGYNKHRAEWTLRNQGVKSLLLKSAAPLLSFFKGSRNTGVGNKLRQLQRFAEGAFLPAGERYWRWCSITPMSDTEALISQHAGKKYNDVKKHFCDEVNDNDFNTVLRADMELVLAGDMLVKVDMMSMANGLEVRNPFIDKDVVDYAFSLPSDYKINGYIQKRIIKDGFKNILPPELFTRSKQGFEVPLLQWFRGSMQPLINELLNEEYILHQGLFNPIEVQKLKSRIHSSHPGDVAARLWALIVFQYWYKKYFMD